jgi:hypothetical protein
MYLHFFPVWDLHTSSLIYIIVENIPTLLGLDLLRNGVKEQYSMVSNRRCIGSKLDDITKFHCSFDLP